MMGTPKIFKAGLGVAMALGLTMGGNLTAKAEGDADGKSLSLDDAEQLRALAEAKNKLTELGQQIDKWTNDKKLDCLAAVDDLEFCTCIAHTSPIGINFVGYVQIVTQTKEQLGYDQLSKEDQGMIDNTRAAREKCVAEVHK